MSTLPGNPHADEAKTMTHRAGETITALCREHEQEAKG